MRFRALIPIYIVWRLWRRDRRRLKALEQTAHLQALDDSEIALAEVSLARAVETLDIELGTADTIDLKAVGLATADVAGVTILVAVHKNVPEWWLSASIFGAALACFILVLRQRVWVYSPPPEKFRRDNEGKSRVEITTAMRNRLEGYRDKNEPLLIDKAAWFKLGYQAMATGVVVLGFTSLVHLFFD